MAMPTWHPTGSHDHLSHDHLSRDHMLRASDTGGSLAGRIVAGALLGALLALAAEFGGQPQQTVERLTLPAEAPPPIVVEGR